ncbi:MAG TPA: glycosyltransferase family 4 protein [Candidatus Angelobacter sp.]|nr:glycosyltransferase family 4 protein [Candidatus Angelobacter sp.]
MRSDKLRVLQLISSGGYYGAENMLLNLCLGQEKSGCRNSLVLFYNVHVPSVEFYERARRRGISVRMVHCQGRADWRAVRQIREYIHEDGADLIHTHGYKADIYGYFAARSEHKPVVATCHNWVGGTKALDIYNRLDRWVLKKFSAIAAVSAGVKERLIGSGIPANRIKLIDNGIDVEGFARPHVESPNTNSKVIGVVARLDLQKGFEYLLAAMSRLCQDFPGLSMVVSGEGPDRKAIEQMIVKYGLEKNVLLAGQQSDMPSVYAAMDIFVLPSLNEGLPMTVLEAMAAAKPIVATRVGAIPNVIRDGETGLLVDPRDEAGLRHAITRLLTDPDLCRRIGTEAQGWVGREYTSDAMALQYRALYEEALGRTNSLVASPGLPVENSHPEVREA